MLVAYRPYFSKLWASKFYNQLRESGKKALKSMPQAASFIKLTEGIYERHGIACDYF